MNDIRTAIAQATKSVTKAWTRAKRQADRNNRVSRARVEQLRHRPARRTIRDAAFSVMEEAYNKASANSRYFANARQIMYAARPYILEHCRVAEFDDVYFTQTLLKDYLEVHEPDWGDNVVWDARGHLAEPHTGRIVPLGGINVRQYIDSWHCDIRRHVPAVNRRIDTHGPENRFSSALFIEKEGFDEILKHAGIDKRFDMEIMSTKGVPTKVACDVILAMHQKGVRIFVVHDFDYAGFKILRTLMRGTRLATGSPVIGLGLRLDDVDGLPSEPVSYRQRKHPSHYLRFCGATDEEIGLLANGGRSGSWTGRRVEINAMTSDQLIAWLERKFEEHGVRKVLPDDGTLSAAYRRAVFLQYIEAEIAVLTADFEDGDVPKRLAARVKALLRNNPALSWDEAVWHLAAEAE